MHDGVWDKSARGSHEVRGRTLGIVGYGNIGTQLSNVAEALGMRVVFYDKADRPAHGNARRTASLGELLEIADVVSLHVDGRPGNAGLFGAAEFAFGVGPLGPDPLVAEGGMVLKGGRVTVPTGPGLGLVLDPEALERLTLQKTAVTA